MKIAFITEDSKTISQHFGRAPYYLVITVENGQETERETREKMGHRHFAGEPHDQEVPGQPHGFGPSSESRHERMAAGIADCEALVCGGMGMGAYQSMQAHNIRPIVTDVLSIDEALQSYLDGNLVDQREKLH